MIKGKYNIHRLLFISMFLCTLLMSCSTQLTEQDNFKILNLENLKAEVTNEQESLQEKILDESKSLALSNEEINLLNELLLDCMNRFNAGNYEETDKIDFKSYKWFAIPLLNVHGDKMVYIKAYKSDSSEKWLDFKSLQPAKDAGISSVKSLINLSYQRAGTMLRVEEVN